MELLDLEYLGTPYSNGSDFLINFRAEIVDMISCELTNQGRAIYSPISSWHHIASKFKMPRTFDFWKMHNLSFLRQCKKLLVVMLPGWQDSTGLKGEIEYACDNNIPIEYIDVRPYFEKLRISFPKELKRNSYEEDDLCKKINRGNL